MPGTPYDPGLLLLWAKDLLLSYTILVFVEQHQIRVGARYQSVVYRKLSWVAGPISTGWSSLTRRCHSWPVGGRVLVLDKRYRVLALVSAAFTPEKIREVRKNLATLA